MSAVIAALDCGTSSVKFAIATSDGHVLARAQRSYQTQLDVTGQPRQRPDDWWQTAAALITESGIGQSITALGITGHMQDLIPVAADRALEPMLLYSDTRAAAQHAQLHAALPHWEQRTGNQQDVTSVPAKIAWLAEHHPATLKQANQLLFGAADYLCWRATGVAACDLVTASTTGMLDIASRNWSAEIVAACGARADQMPTLIGVTEHDACIGTATKQAAEELGIPAGIPVVHALGDAGATTDGLIGSEPGVAYLYLGTTGWFAAITDQAQRTEATPIHSLALPDPRTSLRIGAVQSAGATADWARNTFFRGHDIAAVDRLATACLATPDALKRQPLALPGLHGERIPVRDADFRGAFVGVQSETEPIDFYLATLTGVALCLRHAADALGITQSRLPMVGGGATSSAWRRIIAEVFDATVLTRPNDDPGTHAALRATAQALALGDCFAPLFAADDTVITETVPSAARTAYARILPVHRELYDALAPSFHRLAHRH